VLREREVRQPHKSKKTTIKVIRGKRLTPVPWGRGLSRGPFHNRSFLKNENPQPLSQFVKWTEMLSSLPVF
jgi:hypothetical protein